MVAKPPPVTARHQCATEYSKGRFIFKPEEWWWWVLYNRYNTIDMIQYYTIKYNIIWYDTWYATLWYDTIRYMIRYDTIHDTWNDTIWYDTMRYMIRYNPCGEVKSNGECISSSKYLLRRHPFKDKLHCGYWSRREYADRSEVGVVIALVLAYQLIFPKHSNKDGKKVQKNGKKNYQFNNFWYFT